MFSSAITVTQLNNYVKSLIENDVSLNFISVSGEISNFKNHYTSGHWYFTLKDNNSSIRCVMFRSSANRVKFSVEDGMSATLKGRVSLYEKDGQYQFYAEEMHIEGEGDLALVYKQTMEKLKAEGLFDAKTKRQLVKFPKKIAVVTSDTGAAIKDILNILKKRYPACEVLVCPVMVQGDTAAKDMVDTLDRVYKLSDIDTIIIGRGGGSAEDLWAFNDESLARKIYESPFPVISAVGHETDFTICDFVADVRASTPSHAAELAVSDINELIFTLEEKKRFITNRIFSKYEFSVAKLDALFSAITVSSPENIIAQRQLFTDRITDKIITLTEEKLAASQYNLGCLVAQLDAISPLKTLSRGYAVAIKNGETVRSVNHLSKNDKITLRFTDGTAECDVIKSERN